MYLEIFLMALVDDLYFLGKVKLFPSGLEVLIEMNSRYFPR
jgi:hypothetical protein